MDRPGCPACAADGWKTSYARGRRAGSCTSCGTVFEVYCCDRCDDCVPVDTATRLCGEERLCLTCADDDPRTEL